MDLMPVSRAECCHDEAHPSREIKGTHVRAVLLDEEEEMIIDKTEAGEGRRRHAIHSFPVGKVVDLVQMRFSLPEELAGGRNRIYQVYFGGPQFVTIAYSKSDVRARRQEQTFYIPPQTDQLFWFVAALSAEEFGLSVCTVETELSSPEQMKMRGASLERKLIHSIRSLREVSAHIDGLPKAAEARALLKSTTQKFKEKIARAQAAKQKAQEAQQAAQMTREVELPKLRRETRAAVEAALRSGEVDGVDQVAANLVDSLGKVEAAQDDIEKSLSVTRQTILSVETQINTDLNFTQKEINNSVGAFADTKSYAQKMFSTVKQFFCKAVNVHELEGTAFNLIALVALGDGGHFPTQERWRVALDEVEAGLIQLEELQSSSSDLRRQILEQLTELRQEERSQVEKKHAAAEVMRLLVQLQEEFQNSMENFNPENDERSPAEAG
eukprot:RCo043418